MKDLLAKIRSLLNDKRKTTLAAGQYKKLSFESPEVMLEEKSALHFSIMKQEATEVAAIWAALHLDRLCDAEIMQFCLFL
jgi:hypothetical protein